ncbi:PhoPQ-activated pathogenicity-related family protein [Poriferisphaera sp. WC338]|uniref:PhoPQ-activated pathogenicity-related family protein n=1 Tax=Poriferisphaera sp. WC338 TaxID=3425129 RepID=UPI003D81405F
MICSITTIQAADKQLDLMAKSPFASSINNADSDLHRYVAAEDDSFSYKIVSEEHHDNADILIVRLTSQTWQDKPWQHWLYIINPKNASHPDKAVLAIAGGSNSRDMTTPRKIRPEGHIAKLIKSIGTTVAILKQVPNQPLMDGLKEDALISETFKAYVDGGGQDPTLPLLLPMTKSAVRAMDAVSEICHQKFNQPKNKFVVTGASKRGWTTWLTGAVDSRVIGIAPLVIDVLNMMPQMKQQLQSYGRYSDMIDDYRERGILTSFNDPVGQKLWQTIDPFSYRNLLDMPKMIVLGASDPYWTVDASSLYFPHMLSPKFLHIVPNAGHRLNMSPIPTLVGFVHSVMAELPLPRFEWDVANENQLTLTWDIKPLNVMLWTAESESRDFRQAKWKPTALQSISATGCEIDLATPTTGYRAVYAQAQFNSSNTQPIQLSTQIFVTPNTFPFAVNPDHTISPNIHQPSQPVLQQ